MFSLDVRLNQLFIMLSLCDACFLNVIFALVLTKVSWMGSPGVFSVYQIYSEFQSYSSVCFYSQLGTITNAIGTFFIPSPSSLTHTRDHGKN